MYTLTHTRTYVHLNTYPHVCTPNTFPPRRAILSREEANTSKAEDAQFFSRAGFARLGVTPPLIAALGAVGIERPSHVQVGVILWIVVD